MPNFLVLTTTLSIALAPFLFASPPAMACDYVSYWKTADGRCIDLTFLTDLSSIRSEIAAENREQNPVVFSNLRIQSGQTIVYMKGTAVNQSSRPIKVSNVDYQLRNKNGQIVASDTAVIDKTIQAGRSVGFEGIISKDHLEGSPPQSLTIEILEYD